MKILIAEDDLTSRKMLEAILGKWGYEVVATSNGQEAWEALQMDDPPPLAILDWMMPGMDGLEFCQKVRQVHFAQPPYIILLTGKRQKEDVISGLEAGANDYIRKPFDRDELRARIQVGERVVRLESALSKRVKELQEALSRLKTLEGLFPVCCYCKKIRDDQNYWQQWEAYISAHTKVEITHGVCPDCFEKYIKSQLGNCQAEGEAKLKDESSSSKSFLEIPTAEGSVLPEPNF